MMSLRKPLALLLIAGLAVASSASIAANAPAGAGGAAGALPANADLSKIANEPLLEDADVVRGKRVYSANGGNCISCHGWDGNGTGKNPRSEGNAALLRQSALNAAGFIEIISCGIPSSPMPYHDSQAYKDDRCYGMTAEQFELGAEPHKGKALKKNDIVNLVAYIMTSIQGKPEATYDDCVAWFESSADKNCAAMQQ